MENWESFMHEKAYSLADVHGIVTKLFFQMQNGEIDYYGNKIDFITSPLKWVKENVDSRIIEFENQ
jgi:hypothetical protein